METSIKIKKFWFADILASGLPSTNWEEIQIGQREASVQFQGSDADVSNYKNVVGGTLQSARSAGDKSVNFQLADLTPSVVAKFTGGSVTETAESIKYEAPENENQVIEKAVKFLTETNVLFVIPRCSFDGYPVILDDDLHFYQMNSIALQPENETITSYSMEILLLPSANDIETFTMPEETGAATIDTGAHTVAIEVVNGTVPSALTPSITASLGSSISPGSDTEQDFSSPVNYTVVSADGTSQVWVVTVTVAV